MEIKIEHLAIWVKDLEKMKEFYCEYFDAVSNEMYHNPKKNFRSYFLSFSGGTRIELMNNPDISDRENVPGLGFAHFALSLGSRKQVDSLTEKFRQAGISIVGEPRTTGDGYYESVIADPEGNLIELTV